MLAFTFPGQGSQKPGMGLAWRDHPSWELVADASDAAERDCEKLLCESDADELRQPRNTQLATFLMSMIVLDAVERLGVAPALVAGHSLGEYTALAATGSVSFEEAVNLVSLRGEAMQAAADDQPGTMIALLGIDDDAADAACRRADGDAWVANYNAPGQVVIAGAADALDRAVTAAKDLGAKRAMPLAVGGAFHTPYMAPARDQLRAVLARTTFRTLEIPAVANIDARPHQDSADWPALLSAQLCSPVRWRQSVSYMADAGVNTFVELGPGGVLTGMAKRIAPDAKAISVALPGDLDTLLDHINAASSPATGPLEGEQLHVLERLVVSPSAGVFTVAGGVTPTTTVRVGGVIGHVSASGNPVEVRSPFSGKVMGLLAHDGERVTSGQPIAWLVTA